MSLLLYMVFNLIYSKVGHSGSTRRKESSLAVEKCGCLEAKDVFGLGLLSLNVTKGFLRPCEVEKFLIFYYRK